MRDSQDHLQPCLRPRRHDSKFSSSPGKENVKILVWLPAEVQIPEMNTKMIVSSIRAMGTYFLLVSTFYGNLIKILVLAGSW